MADTSTYGGGRYGEGRYGGSPGTSVSSVASRYVQPEWGWKLGPWTGRGPDTELPSIANRTLTVKLQDPAEASFSVLGDSPDAYEPQELMSDLWISRNGEQLFRGRVTSSSDTVGSTSYGVQFGVSDYSALLNRRIINTNGAVVVDGAGTQYGLAYATTPPETLIWDLITHAQNQPGMNLGIIKGDWPSLGVVPWTEGAIFADGDYIYPHIQAMTKARQFDFWIDADKHANVAMSRGADNGVAIDYGGLVASVNRSFSHEAFANFVRQSGFSSGNISSVATTYTAPNIEHAPEGGWASQINAPTAVAGAIGDSPSTLDTKLKALLQEIGQANFDRLYRALPTTDNPFGGNFTYSVTLALGAWGGPSHIWVGDTVRLVLKRGRLNIDEQMRVFEVSINLDQNNTETVSLTLNFPNNKRDKVKQFAAGVYQLGKR